MNDPVNINPSKRMQTAIVVALSMLSVFLLFQTFGVIKSNSNIGIEPGQNIISVSGKGEVFATADIANFTYTVEQEGSTVADAQKKAGEVSAKAIKVLKSAGIEDKDMKTTGYNVGPKYEYNTKPCGAYGCPPGNPTIVGYTVSENIRVKVRKIDTAGTIISNLGETGVTNLSNLDFTVDDEDVLSEEARSLAIVDAKNKAKKLAKDLGVSLGEVVNFNEETGGSRMYYDKAYGVNAQGLGAPVANVTIQKGENKITVNVNVTYRIR